MSASRDKTWITEAHDDKATDSYWAATQSGVGVHHLWAVQLPQDSNQLHLCKATWLLTNLHVCTCIDLERWSLHFFHVLEQNTTSDSVQHEINVVWPYSWNDQPSYRRPVSVRNNSISSLIQTRLITQTDIPCPSYQEKRLLSCNTGGAVTNWKTKAVKERGQAAGESGE